jgi:hypothetical protein
MIKLNWKTLTYIKRLIIYIFNCCVLGVDDGIAPYLGHFIALDIDGSKLENIDSDSLKRIGINKEATRIKIIAAVNLLLYYVCL